MSTDGSNMIQPINVADLIEKERHTPDFVMDGIHFGRGNKYINNSTNETYKYKPLEIKCWEINDTNSLTKIKPELTGHFYATCNYYVYANYETKVYDSKTGEEYTERSTTYDLCFYWRGANGPATAPFPEELEEINPPVERIVQWSEPPIFVRLFNGTLVIHADKQTQRDSRLYVLRGTMDEEAHFIEVPAEKRSLRSRTSLLLVALKRGKIFIWNGKHCDKLNLVLMKNAAEQLQRSRSAVYGVSSNFEVVEINQGVSEDGDFNNSLMGTNDDFYSLVKDNQLFNYTPRLFYFNSIIGTFLATEVENALASGNTHNPFPFLQNHLYSAKQPALFLFDDYYDLWLWQGWKPDDAFNEKDLAKFSAERKAAVETAIRYSIQKYPESKREIYLVAAGLEPLEFTNLFPFWSVRRIPQNLQLDVDEYVKQNVSLQYLL